MAEPSFQDVFRLMNSMASFEELLDATAIKPETCVALGIHEKFKQLLEKLAKYVQHDETKDSTFKSICNVCNNEMKVLNHDIRTSLAIHNAGELHRIAAKTAEIDKQDEDFRGKTVQRSIDSKNVPSDVNVVSTPVDELANNVTAKDMDTKSDGKEGNLDLETKPVACLTDLKKELLKYPTGELAMFKNVLMELNLDDVGTRSVPHLLDFSIVPSESPKSLVKNVDTTGKDQDLSSNTAVGQLIDLNNVPSELLRPASNTHKIPFVSNNLDANVPITCTICRQVFCVCGYKDTNNLLNGKMSNVKVTPQQKVAPLPLFPPPQGSRQPNPNAAANRGRNRSPQRQRNANRKPQEKRSASVSAASVEPSIPPPPTQQYVNVHVHMPPSIGQPAEAYRQQPLPFAAPHHQTQNKKNNTHMPPSIGQPAEAYRQQPLPFAAPHHQTQNKKNNTHMPPSIGQPAEAYRQQSLPFAAPHLHPPPQNTRNNTVEENLELLRSKSLPHREEMQLMYRMLRQAESGYWRRNHFDKVLNQAQGRHEYLCNVCATGSYMNCSFQVVQHARGRAHQVALRAGRGDQEEEEGDEEDPDRSSECVVM